MQIKQKELRRPKSTNVIIIMTKYIFKLKLYDSTCFILHLQVEHSKISLRYAICVFLGYEDGKKGYRCYDTSSKKLYVSHYVVFLEHILFYFIFSNFDASIRFGLTSIIIILVLMKIFQVTVMLCNVGLILMLLQKHMLHMYSQLTSNLM